MATSNFDYTTRDFSTIRQELGRRAAEALPEWADSDPSDFMNVLIDLWAYMGDVMHFYIDRAAREAFVSTATQRESLLALANMYDYTPTGTSRSRVTVNVSNTTEESIVVPAGTTFSGTNNGSTFTFYSEEDVTIPPNASGSVVVYEGSLFDEQTLVSSSGTTTSDGSSSQRFYIPFPGVDLTTVRVFVAEGDGGELREWTLSTRLSNAAAADSVFTTNLAADGTVYVQFGNGVNGRIPPVGITVKASFATCSGSLGNVPTNTVNTITSAGLTGLTVSTSTGGTGGYDVESVESMKTSIPRAFRAQERAVTLQDFADLSLGVAGVAKAKAEYLPGTASTGSSVAIYAVPYQDGYSSLSASVTTLSIDPALRSAIKATLEPLMTLGVAAVDCPESISLTNIYVRIALQVKSGYVRSRVQDAVLKAVDPVFDFDNIDFGKTMTVGEVYRAILGVEGVDWAVVTQFNTESNVNELQDDGFITVDPFRLPKKGIVLVAASGGIDA